MEFYFPFLKNLIFILIIVLSAFNVSKAQDDDDEPPMITTVASTAAVSQRVEDEDKTGSTVRGRVFYENTSIPVRRGWLGLIKIRELVEEKPADGDVVKAARIGGYNAEKYVLTNDNGEFVIKSVKSGIYQPTFKTAGILNAVSSKTENPVYQSITIDGISEITIQVPAKRGGSVSGRVEHFDGSPVIGAKVQLVNKKPTERAYIYSGDDLLSDTTDDRGFYHFAGLPDGEYIVRVTEPSIHNEANTSVDSYNMSNYSYSSILTTFYPNVSKNEEATVINVAAGQEQSDINISIPDRRLFKISGSIVAKNNPASVKNLKIAFRQIGGEQSYNYYSEQTKQAKTDEQGKWSFVDLPKGKYLIQTSSEPEPTYPKPAAAPEKQTKFAEISKEIEIDNENVQDVILELTAESVLSGTVSVEGGKDLPSYVSMLAFDPQSKSDASTSLNNNQDAKDKSPVNKKTKSFRIGTLAAGKYNFAVSASDGFYAKSIRSGNIDLTVSPIEIGAGIEINDVQIVLANDIGTLKGKINNFTASERMFVILLPANRSGMNMLVNSGQGAVGKTGEFEVKAAPGEYYAIAVSAANRPNPDKIIEWITEEIAAAPKVTLKANETVSTTLNLPKK